MRGPKYRAARSAAPHRTKNPFHNHEGPEARNGQELARGQGLGVSATRNSQRAPGNPASRTRLIFVDFVVQKRGCEAASSGQHIRKDEPVTFDDLAELDRQRVLEHRAGVRERVELATLAAGVNRCRQRLEQRGVEGTSRERSVQHTGIDRGQRGP